MIRRLINVLKEFEEEIRANEKYLTMRLLPRTKKLDNILLEETNSKIR